MDGLVLRMITIVPLLYPLGAIPTFADDPQLRTRRLHLMQFNCSSTESDDVDRGSELHNHHQALYWWVVQIT